MLGHDLEGDDAIARCLAPVMDGFALMRPAELRDIGVRLVVGQGAGPVEGDRAELAAIAQQVPGDVPIATALARAGHTLGASSLLSVSLAAALTGDGQAAADLHTIGVAERLLARDERSPQALDGRPLGAPPAGLSRAAAVCRALGGACGAVMVGDVVETPSLRLAPIWGTCSEAPPLHDPTLRRIAAEALDRRPDVPPDVLVVTLDAPLPPAARIGQRILPTSVLEMTPGFVPRLVARAWGYRGPALCLVGPEAEPLLAALRTTHERVYRLAIRGMHERDVEWIPRG